MTPRRIPAAFYRDHVERDLPAPPIIRQTRAFIWIDDADPALADLISDARFYADDKAGPDWGWYTGAARRLLESLEAA